MPPIERIDVAESELALDQKQNAEDDQGRMEHDALELRPNNGIDHDEEDHHGGRDPGRRPGWEEAGDQDARHQGMRCLEADPGGKPESEARQLQREQANNTGEKRHREQQDGVL